MTPTPIAEMTDLWGVAIPAWVGAGASVLGTLIAVGALVVSILSFRKSTRTATAEANTRGIVEGTLEVLSTPPAEKAADVDVEALVAAEVEKERDRKGLYEEIAADIAREKDRARYLAMLKFLQKNPTASAASNEIRDLWTGGQQVRKNPTAGRYVQKNPGSGQEKRSNDSSKG